MVKVYFPRERPIKVHQLRVKPCPQDFPAGYYWYGTKCKGPGRPPRWVERMLSEPEQTSQTDCLALTPVTDEDTSLTPVPDSGSSDGRRPTVDVQLPDVNLQKAPKELPNESASSLPSEMSMDLPPED